MNSKPKYLITSALPYVNYNLHIGHMIGCLLPSDVYARYCRAKNRDVLFIGGADEHGTTAEIGAMRENMTPENYVDFYRAAHLDAVSNFNLSFDLYGRTHTQQHIDLVQSLFTRLDNAGFIEERVSSQPYSVLDEMFLADRYVIGTCPKCGNNAAYGNECSKCVSTLEPSDLINPRSTINPDSPVVMRETRHLYFRTGAMSSRLREWINTRVGWPKTAMAIANKWLDDGLRSAPITRDLKWGIPVNKPGFEGKVFYVWFDAPWGYVSISQIANKNWADWWKNDDCHYSQFMGKDNVAFHAVFFPAQELAVNDGWKTVDVLKAMNFLNFEGEKISKSTGNGIFLNDAINDAPADVWRYALISSTPETDDSDFTIQRFADIVNKDLNGILGNFVSRVCKLTEKNFGFNVPKSGKTNLDITDLNSKLSGLNDALDACEFRRAIFYLREIWGIGNEFMTINAPWTMIKNGDTESAGFVLNECFQLIDLYSKISEPFIPNTAEKMRKIFKQCGNAYWCDTYEHPISDGTEFSVPENLFERIDAQKISEMTARYSRKNKDVSKIIAAKIIDIVPHSDKDGLNILTVDTGDEKLQIVCAAPNVRVGFIGVLAMVGAILPGTKKPIIKRNVSGIESNGMMLSASEIGIGADSTALYQLPDDAVLGLEFVI